MSTVLAMQICSSISCLCSCFIIIIFTRYNELRKTELAKLVNLICLCDLFSSMGMSLGHPENGTVKCWFQAILTNIFPIGGVLWTTLIAYMLLINVFKMRPVEKFPIQIYIICWIIPVVFTFLPLTTNQFGTHDNEKSNGWCFLRNRSDSPSWTLIFWTAVSFYLWMWGGMIIYLILIFLVVFEAYRIFSVNPNLPSWNSFGNIIKYFIFPFNLFVCWFPATIYDFLETSNYESYEGKEILATISDIAPTLLGFANAIGFLCTNQQFQRKVWVMFRSVSSNYDDDDEPIRVVFQEEERAQRESEMTRQQAAIQDAESANETL